MVEQENTNNVGDQKLHWQTTGCCREPWSSTSRRHLIHKKKQKQKIPREKYLLKFWYYYIFYKLFLDLLWCGVWQNTTLNSPKSVMTVVYNAQLDNSLQYYNRLSSFLDNYPGLIIMNWLNHSWYYEGNQLFPQQDQYHWLCDFGIERFGRYILWYSRMIGSCEMKYFNK